MRHALLITLLLLSGCSAPQEELRDWTWQQITGRDEQPRTGRILRHPVYRAQVPQVWTRIDPPSSESIFDTMKPNVEFLIGTPPHQIVVTVYNFPTENPDQRIPPGMQVSRWRRQIASPAGGPIVKATSHGGFAGLYFEGEGKLRGEPRLVMAWAMQLSLEHYQNLLLPGSEDESRYFKQMRADYTIKAVGPPHEMEIHRDDIHRFAHSFELIQEIPSRL